MSVFVENISESKTIRDFFIDLKKSENSNKIEITIKGNATPLENIDVIWNGNEYYLISATKTTSEEEEEITTIQIISLDSVLPLTITKTAIPNTDTEETN